MKVTQLVQVEAEVDITITLEDIVSAISESTESRVLVLQGIGNCHRFLKAIPDEIVKEQLSLGQLLTIYEALRIQVERFKPAGYRSSET